MFFKIAVLKNFTNFAGKHLCWSLFLIMLQLRRPATPLKRHSNTGVFLWNFQEYLFPQNMVESYFTTLRLTLSWRRCLSSRNKSTDLQGKSMDWFLYDRELRHERAKDPCNFSKRRHQSWCFPLKVNSNFKVDSTCLQYSKLVMLKFHILKRNKVMCMFFL